MVSVDASRVRIWRLPTRSQSTPLASPLTGDLYDIHHCSRFSIGDATYFSFTSSWTTHGFLFLVLICLIVFRVYGMDPHSRHLHYSHSATLLQESRAFFVSYLTSRFIYLSLCLRLSTPTPSMSGDTTHQCPTRDREIVEGNKVVKSTMSIGCILQSMSGVHVGHYRARIRPKSKQEKCRH